MYPELGAAYALNKQCSKKNITINVLLKNAKIQMIYSEYFQHALKSRQTEICAYMHMSMHTCTCMHAHTRTHTCTETHTHTHTHTHMCLHECMYACTIICPLTHTISPGESISLTCMRRLGCINVITLKTKCSHPNVIDCHA